MDSLIEKGYRNEEFINYIIKSKLIENYIPPDEYLEILIKSIDLKTASDNFITKILNNSYEHMNKKFDLSYLLQNKFVAFYQRIFDNFNYVDDLLPIKSWNCGIECEQDKEILTICLKKIIEILNEEAKKAKDGKFGLYPSLMIFFCRLFSKCSLKLNNFLDILDSLEKNFPSSKLIEIYFIILYKFKVFKISKNFKEHIIQYIEEKAGNTALSLWYRLVLKESKDKNFFLYENLKPEYAVKKEDFVGYPLKVDDRILLFKYLYKDDYFKNRDLTGLDYYKISVNSSTRDELFKLPFKSAMKIYIYYPDLCPLFKLFDPKSVNNDFDEDEFNEKFMMLVSELSDYKEKFERLNEILIFFYKFFSNTKKDEINSITKLKKSLNESPLNEFDKIFNENECLKKNENILKDKNLKNSIFFMEIYNASRKKFNEKSEQEHFEYAKKQFNQLSQLGEKCTLNIFNREFSDILISAISKNRNKITDELNFIKSYFNFNKKTEFNSEKLSIEFEELIPEEQKDKFIKFESKDIIDKKISFNPNMKIYEDKFNDCFNYYKNNRKKDDKYYEKFINYFKDLFANEEIQELDPNTFTEFITKKMIILYYSSQIEFPDDLKKNSYKNELQYIKELFYLLNVYKSINNDYVSICENIKKLFSLLNDVISFRGNETFKGYTSLFSGITENDKSKEKLFALCFINMLIEEIKIERIKEDKKGILDYILKNNYLIDNSIPIIDYYFEKTFFNNLKNNSNINNSNIYFKEISLASLDKKCTSSQLLKERLLYYFETNINKIFIENYKENEFIKSEKIKKYVEKIRDYFKNKPEDKNLNENINILFFISFLKVFFTKYIEVIQSKNNLRESIYDEYLTENSFQLTNYLSYFILKLYLDVDGNFLDFLKLNRISIPNDIIKSIAKDINKNFGFDYLVLPLNKNNAEIVTEISSQIMYCVNDSKKFQNDINIMDGINKNDIDILYCIISNLFLSKFSLDNYLTSEEYSILFKWINEKLEKKSFKKLNEHSQKILNILICNGNKRTIKIEYNKDLMNLIFAFRFIFNSLTKVKDNFFFDLITDTSNTISKNEKIFEYFFPNNDDKNKNIRNQNCIGYKIIKYILLSHLICANLFENINLEEIAKLTNIEFEDNNVIKALTIQFKDIQKIMRFYGIKNKYSIIYMNILFEKTKDIKLKEMEKESEYYDRILLIKISEQIQNYFDIIHQIGMSEKMGMNDFKNIIFEDNDYIAKYIKSNPLFNYFTTPNFCDILDFKFQYQFPKFDSKLIEFILNGKMDDFINKINCLPVINSIVNTIYNEKILAITENESKNQNINLGRDLIKKFNDIIPDIKKYFNIDFSRINNDTKINEFLNYNGSKINNLYESFNNILKDYNSLLNDYKQESRIILESNNIQDISNLYFTLNNSKSYAYDRLLQLMRIYSNRNRFSGDNLNVYDGDRILYDFKTIENILIQEFLFKKKLLINSQRYFIFSNEVFSGERNNLIKELILKLDYDENKSSQDKKLVDLWEKIDQIDDDERIKRIYYNLQYILIYIYNFYIKKQIYTNLNISLKEICEKISELGQNKLDEKLYDNEVFIKDILYLYEKLEIKIFDLFWDILSNDKKLDENNLKNEKKEEIDEYFSKNSNLLLTEEIILDSIKKYILRYCLCDHQKNEVFSNFDVNKIFNKEDIWGKKIFHDVKFKDEVIKLNKYNENKNDNLEQYFLCSLFNIGEDDDNENEDKEIDDDKNKDSDSDEE